MFYDSVILYVTLKFWRHRCYETDIFQASLGLSIGQMMDEGKSYLASFPDAEILSSLFTSAKNA